MRFKHWLSTVFGSVLVAASTITVQAQSPAGNSPEPGFAPVGMSMSGYGPPSMYSPWPELSPYQDTFSQQQFDGGVWSQIERQSTRRYQLNIDYLTGQTRTSNSLIGHPQAQSYVDLLQFQLGGQQGGGGGGGQQQQSPLQPFIDNPRQNQRGFELFGAFDFRKNKQKMDNDGVNILWGYDRADDSGFRLGFLTNQGTFNYNARSGLPSGRDNQREYAEFIIEKLHIINELNAIGNTAAAAQIQSELAQLAAVPSTQIGVFNDPNLVLQNNIDNLNGLPLDDGTLVRFPDGTTIGGVTVPYDLEFKVDLRSELYGGNAEIVMSPVLNWGSLRVRPTVGARYFYLAERFHFFGRDSGLAYNGSQQGGGGGQQTLSPDVKIHSPPDRIDNNGDGIVDNAGVPETGQGGGGGQQQQQQLAFFSFHDHFRYPIESFLNNESDQHLGGGEIGLNYEFGSRSFLLSGATKFGLLANYGRIRMSGDNIAMHTRDADLLLPTEDDATPNSFTDSKDRSHVSPMFIQSITAEAPLFRYVPILRRSSILEKARFRFGYSFLLIGQVTDTAGSVLWQGNPSADLFPKIREKRNTYATQNYNIGVSWEF
jgi:hypothetical protein